MSLRELRATNRTPPANMSGEPATAVSQVLYPESTALKCLFHQEKGASREPTTGTASAPMDYTLFPCDLNCTSAQTLQ